MALWESPDGKIRKTVVKKGEWGLKPYENSRCRVNILGCELERENGEREVVIGENDSEFGRLLDKCLMMMDRNEQAEITFKLDVVLTLILHLIDYEHKGFVYEWDAKRKYDLASHHNHKGKQLFKDNFKEASHRFGKALKILCSIPIEVEAPPKIIDDIEVSEINHLKANLYNNLASCYLKNGNDQTAIELCGKVLSYEPDNVKALYKMGVAWCNEHDYEKARSCLQKAADLEPDNKAAREKLLFATVKLKEAETRVNFIIKKMFEM